jgi:hypothetical protein
MWQMQINMGTESEPKWVSVSQKDKPPYEYETEDDARRMLRICYPDQVREDRLMGREVLTRVIEVNDGSRGGTAG